ncbi:MAG: protoheme IX farnesyltransferase [Magnetococcales bacterium]|nr:protoheme IX farnesyltransferase [Magnetococcales bacterium]
MTFGRVEPFLVLLKPRIGVAIAMTALAGMYVATGQPPTTSHILLLMAAILLSSAAVGCFNHYYDHDIDALMQRTQQRPFVTGSLPRHPLWLLFIAVLLIVPILLLGWIVGLWPAFFTFLGAFFYAVIYTIWLKRRTWLNIVIGGAAGSCAILAGSTMVAPPLAQPLPLLFALILFLWTPPHFWSLAITLRADFVRANLPMLPVIIGDQATAYIVLGHTLLLGVVSLVPVIFGMGWVYLTAATGGGLFFLWRSIQLVRHTDSVRAYSSFRASLLQLGLMLAGAIVDAQIYHI